MSLVVRIARAPLVATLALLLYLFNDRCGLAFAHERDDEQSFSTSNALRTLTELAALGPRELGTESYVRAGDWLAERLRQIPRLELTVDDSSGLAPAEAGRPAPVSYHVRNIVARLGGSTRDAIALVAHYDSAPGSPGASDDGLAVAALIELARSLSTRPPLAMSLVIILDGGEEAMHVGAMAYRRNPIAADIRALINVDAVGGRGRPTVVGASDDALGLLQAYGRAVGNAPAAAALADDLRQTSLIGSDTDLKHYRATTPVPSLDIAFIGDGYAYHLPLDVASRVDPISLEQLGGMLRNLVTIAGANPAVLARRTPGPVYYDVLGRWFIAYGRGTALTLALLIALSLAVAMVRARHTRPARDARALLRGVLDCVLVAISGVGMAVALGLFLALVAHRPMGWFPRQGAALFAFGCATALGAALASRALFLRSGPERVEALRWVVPGFGAVFTVAAALSGVRAGYLALWWTLTFAAPLVVRRWAPRAAWGPTLALVPGLVLMTREGLRVLAYFVPAAGRTASPIPPDVLIAVIVAVIAAPFLASSLWFPRRVPVRALVASAALGTAAATILLIVSPPFTAACPKRILLQSLTGPGGGSRILARAYEPTALVSALGEGAWVPADAADRVGWMGPVYARPGSDIMSRPADVHVVDEQRSADGLRRVTVRIRSDAPLVVLRVPRERLERWSWGALPAEHSRGAEAVALVVGQPNRDVDLVFSVRESAPLPLRVSQLYYRGTPSTEAIVRALPSWVSAIEQEVRVEGFAI